MAEWRYEQSSMSLRATMVICRSPRRISRYLKVKTTTEFSLKFALLIAWAPMLRYGSVKKKLSLTLKICSWTYLDLVHHYNIYGDILLF